MTAPPGPPAQGSRRLLLLAALLLGAALLGWAGFAGATHLWARQHYELAQQALARDDLDLAQQHLECCLQAWDDQAAVYLLAAQTARRREDFDRADASLTVCERLEPGNASIALERDLLIAQQGEPEIVLRHLQGALKSQAVPVLEALGKGYLNSFVSSDALKCFNALLERQPKSATALFWRGKTHARLERFTKALDDARRAVELAPTLDEARLLLAATLHRLGRSGEALPHYECLRQRLPTRPHVLLGLARCRYDLHEIDAARAILDALGAAHPADAAALLERGRLDFHAGRPVEAEAWLRRATAAAPLDHDSQRTLLLCLEAQGKDSASCQAQLERINADIRRLHRLVARLQDQPRSAALRCQIGQQLERLGRPPDAVSYYFAALAEDPHHAPAHAALADYFQRAGQHYRAARQRRSAAAGKDG